MKKTVVLLSLLFTSFIFCSCVPVNIGGNKEEIKNHKRMVLLEFMIAPHIKPIFPLIDAAIYNSQIDDIAPEILVCNKENVDNFEKFFGEAYDDYSKSEILYGDKLRSSQDYIDLKNIVQVFSNSFDDDDFPIVHIPTNSYNFFPFISSSGSGGIHPLDYFRDERMGIIHERIAKICQALKVDGAIIVVTSVYPVAIQGFFMANWDRGNQIQMNFFDAAGTRFLKMDMSTPLTQGEPGDALSYERALKYYYRYSDFMLNVLFDKQANSKSSMRTFKARFDTLPPKIQNEQKGRNSRW